MFLLPGLVITWYVTETPIPAYYATEMKAYLFARAHAEDGGWGLHIEGESSVFGIVMNYTALRILGVDAEDERMRKARSTLWKLGGALRAPHWAKFWMAVLGVVEWDVVNPVPPELWYVTEIVKSWRDMLTRAGSCPTGSHLLRGAGGFTCDKSFAPCRLSTRDAGAIRSTTSRANFAPSSSPSPSKPLPSPNTVTISPRRITTIRNHGSCASSSGSLSTCGSLLSALQQWLRKRKTEYVG